MPARTSSSSESRFHRGSEWGMRYLEPNPQSWLLTDLRGNLPSTFSVEAGALRSSTQHRSQPISRNVRFASSILFFIRGRPSRYQRNDNQHISKRHSLPLVAEYTATRIVLSSDFGQLLVRGETVYLTVPPIREWRFNRDLCALVTAQAKRTPTQTKKRQ